MKTPSTLHDLSGFSFYRPLEKIKTHLFQWKIQFFMNPLEKMLVLDVARGASTIWNSDWYSRKNKQKT